MNKIIFTVALVASLALLGCTSGRKIDSNQVDVIQKNITTENQIIQIFGQPTAIQINSQQNIKTLTYVYRRDNNAGRSIASTTGAIAGGLLAGKNIGKGSGCYVSSALGSLLGSMAGNKVTTVHSETQTLDIIIDTNTNRVIDYSYRESSANY